MSGELLRLGCPADESAETIDVDTAAAWLLGDDTGTSGYNRITVRLYDFADTDDLTTARQRTPKDRFSLKDLGRATALGASLRFDRAHELLYHRSAGGRSTRRVFDWAGDLPALADLASLDEGAFLAHPGVMRARAWFTELVGLANVGWGTAAKLLHLKWPAFYPITDQYFRDAYRTRAVAAHNRNIERLGGRRRSSTASLPAYWLAFRADLARNHDALVALPAKIEERAGSDVDALAHARRLAQLEPLRLLDMLAWKFGRPS